MKLGLIVAAVLLLPAMMFAQDEVVNLPPMHASASASAGMMSGQRFSFPSGLQAPAGFFDDFWNDPAFAAQLRLTASQRKQLQDAALTQRLALIDSGADALKALVRLSAILDAEPFDDAAYQKQLDDFAATTSKIVQNLGEMAVTPRRVLTTEQFAKLRVRQRAKQLAAKSGAQRPVPSSLLQPMER